jgi:hypothetical protein
MSDTHTSGRIVPNSAVTTALPRLGERARERGWMTCSTASVPMNTHSHQFLPLTRTEVSSEQTTGLANTTFSIAAVAPSKGSRARARMLLIAPSLIDNENSSSINSASRSMPMAWA